MEDGDPGAGVVAVAARGQADDEGWARCGGTGGEREGVGHLLLGEDGGAHFNVRSIERTQLCLSTRGNLQAKGLSSLKTVLWVLTHTVLFEAGTCGRCAWLNCLPSNGVF